MSAPRVGLIGAGGISGVHAAGWRALGADVVVHSEHGAHALADTFGFRTADTLTELWPQVDLVDIVTPTATHAELALAAIAAGKHVICEKPLARTSVEAAAVVGAAEAAGVRVFPAHVVRYFPEYVAARDAIRAGRIGTVAVARFRRMSAAPKADWFFDEARSGGIVLDQMIHDLDQAEWLAGPVARVFARSTAKAGDGGRVASAAVLLTHTSGAISHVYGVWGHPGLRFTSSFEIAGDAGLLRYDMARSDTVRVQLGGPADAGGYLPATDPSESPYAAELADFWAAIESGTQASVAGTDGVRAVALAEAVLASAASGVPVDLPADPADSAHSSTEGSPR
ncbi:Gfo/Idh/MocA family oxidoreductase [Occultella glacieicola]|uniref:Gfo/Idh/MocA family oxidoreductase n=1 Tax=Occultella glacieicola TaxID=2518684 RepID=A0ABY2E2T6_9MICO|nr:Gfo/Idh/MocA family oxidoreductase [Occultella glacieicola]TDE93905.1 Gfo/Idh/MocA family oxidoreductase [Occultella glacieicola]